MLFQFLPRLSDDEYTALEKSIREHGVQVPIVVDESRAVIDGHHRKEIAERIGIECPRRFAMDLTDEQKRTLALSLNLDRRHLSREQKRELVEKSLQADPHLSDRQHAERTGVSPTTVGGRRAAMEASGGLSSLDSRTSADGRERPASQPPRAAMEAPRGSTSSGTSDPAPATDALSGADPTVNTETGEVSDDYDASEEPAEGSADSAPPSEGRPQHGTPPATGRDDKTYAQGGQKSAKAAPRRSLIDDARDAGQELRKALDRVARIAADDRLPRNKEEVAAHLRHHLDRSLDICQDLSDQLNN